jgi:hypothetical protein
VGGASITYLPSASTGSARAGSGGADHASPRTSERAEICTVASHTPRSSREPKRCASTSWTTFAGRRAWPAASVTPWSWSSTTSGRSSPASQGCSPIQHRGGSSMPRLRAVRWFARTAIAAGPRFGEGGGASQRATRRGRAQMRASTETWLTSSASYADIRASIAESAIPSCSSSTTSGRSGRRSPSSRGTAAASRRSTPRSANARCGARTVTGARRPCAATIFGSGS